MFSCLAGAQVAHPEPLGERKLLLPATHPKFPLERVWQNDPTPGRPGCGAKGSLAAAVGSAGEGAFGPGGASPDCYMVAEVGSAGAGLQRTARLDCCEAAGESGILERSVEICGREAVWAGEISVAAGGVERACDGSGMDSMPVPPLCSSVSPCRSCKMQMPWQEPLLSVAAGGPDPAEPRCAVGAPWVQIWDGLEVRSGVLMLVGDHRGDSAPGSNHHPRRSQLASVATPSQIPVHDAGLGSRSQGAEICGSALKSGLGSWFRSALDELVKLRFVLLEERGRRCLLRHVEEQSWQALCKSCEADFASLAQSSEVSGTVAYVASQDGCSELTFGPEDSLNAPCQRCASSSACAVAQGSRDLGQGSGCTGFDPWFSRSEGTGSLSSVSSSSSSQDSFECPAVGSCPRGTECRTEYSNGLEGGQVRRFASQIDVQTLVEDLCVQVEAQKKALKDLGLENAHLRESLGVVLSRLERLELHKECVQGQLNDPVQGVQQQVVPQGLLPKAMGSPEPSQQVELNLRPPGSPITQENPKGEPMLPLVALALEARPQFDGQDSSWETFERQWGEHEKMLCAALGSKVPEVFLLAELQKGLDLASRLTLQLRKEQNPHLTCGQFMQELRRAHSCDTSLQDRQAWENVTFCPKDAARSTLAIWNSFRAEFELKSSRVRDKAFWEEHRLLFRQLPRHWQEKVVKAEQKKARSQFWVRISHPEEWSRCDLRIWLETAIGQRVQEVQSMAGGSAVECSSKEILCKTLDLHGSIVRGHSVRVSRMDRKFTSQEILDLVTDLLRTQEKVDRECTFCAGASAAISGLKVTASRSGARCWEHPGARRVRLRKGAPTHSA